MLLERLDDLFTANYADRHFLAEKEKKIIHDAKYYNRTLYQQLDKCMWHSGNVYQIFARVKN